MRTSENFVPANFLEFHLREDRRIPLPRTNLLATKCGTHRAALGLATGDRLWHHSSPAARDRAAAARVDRRSRERVASPHGDDG
jgi:hypothetical protein